MRTWLPPLVVVVLAVVPFVPALQAGFVNWDDDHNFVENPHYRGLSGEHLVWMLTSTHHGGYYPVAWLTFGLDHVLWGMDPEGYHLTNLVVHAVNAGLLYALVLVLLARLGRTTGPRTRWAAALAVAFFAVHPLRAESVAWVTERRGLLAALFALACVLLYVKAVEQTSRRRLLALTSLSVAAFALSLLSKVIAITLPGVLLLLDLCVLDRRRRAGFWRLVLEKWPWFAAAVLVGVLARLAQTEEATTRSLAEHPLDARFSQACYGLCFYLWKTVVPLDLGPLYPLQERIDTSAPRFLLPALAVLGVTAWLIVKHRRWPMLLAAWCAYALILLPVLGFAQSGPQLVADRYTYLGTVPVVVLLAGLLARGLAGRRAPLLAAASAVVVLGFGALSLRQTRIWQDSVSLWEHATRVEPGCVEAHHNLGQALMALGRNADAVAPLRKCVRILPGYADPRVDLGLALFRTGRHEQAYRAWRERLSLPGASSLHLYYMAVASFELDRLGEAVTWLDRLREADPGYALAWMLAAQIHERRGEAARAVEAARRALALDGSLQEARAILQRHGHR